MNSQKPHWEVLSQSWQRKHPQRLWREHCDAVNLAMLQKWWPGEGVESVLKTDLFDEVFGQGLYPFIQPKGSTLSAIDVSESIVSAARTKYPEVQAMVADVRRLPVKDDTYDLIISNSTLDHFESGTDISVALRELYRVLKPGGHLLLTLDNLCNPVIALRQALPFRLMNAIGVVPYFVGATFGPRGLRREVRRAGFRVIETESVMHSPRVVAVAIAGLLQRHAKPRTQQRFLRGLMAFEKLARLPTRYFTGHFVAVRAVKETPLNQ
jgi:SAM-dependent methyltransferase